MPNVLVAGKIHNVGLELLRAAPGVNVDYVEEVSTASYRPFMPGADAVLIRTQPMPAEVIREAPSLRIVSRHGVGFDSVDLAELNRRGIPLTVVGDVNSRPVAEHTMLLLLAAAKRLVPHDSAVRRGDWSFRNRMEAAELDGKILLIIGFGRIGRHVAAMAAPFGLKILAHDPFQSEAMITAGGALPVGDLQTALPAADFVTVHAPKVDGRAIIGAAELARMKPTAILVNTARGGIIDEPALTAALDAGSIGGAALDVFDDEPPAPGNALLASSRTVLTPHIAGLTAECAERMAIVAAQNILDFFDGRLDPALVVNPETTRKAADDPPA
jgi:D-3-phosphoglycerate dehydrogenase